MVAYVDPVSGIGIASVGFSGSQIVQLARDYTVGADTITDILSYTYFSSGSAAGKIASVVWSQEVNYGAPVNIKAVTYAYYGAFRSQRIDKRSDVRNRANSSLPVAWLGLMSRFIIIAIGCPATPSALRMA